MLSETKWSESFSNDFPLTDEVSLFKPIILKCVLLENKAFRFAIYFLEATWTWTFGVYSCQDNTKLYAKYINAIFDY